LRLRLQPGQGRARLRAGLSAACRDISVLIGHCVIATLEGRAFAEAFAELAEAERLMHIWDVPPIYYLAMITLVKCELWLAQGRTDLAESWLLRLGQTYGGEQPAAAPEFHPLLPLHIELQQALLDRVLQRPREAESRLQALVERGQANGGMTLVVSASCQLIELLLAEGREAEACKCWRTPGGCARGALQPSRGLSRSTRSGCAINCSAELPARPRRSCWRACPRR
jgi:LuxR family maltose regulon positive regulatory protein